MAQPKVSVVIPIYNVEKYLNRCVNSVVNQTYKNLEIILVDDGSPDSCPEICDEWAEKDSRIKVIHKVNQGLGMARNTGIENATGEYIFFFDSDDYVDVKTVEKCLTATEKSLIDSVIFSRFDCDESGALKEIKISADKLYFEDKDIKEILLPSMFNYGMGFGVSSCGKMFRLSVIKNNGIFFKSEKEIISEDAFFMLEFFSHAHSAAIVPECLYYYCVRNNSLSRSYKKGRQQKNNLFLEKSIELIKSKNLSESVETHLKARYHVYTLSALKQVCVSNLNKKEKKEELGKIMRDPVLRKTLKYNVLNKEKPFVRLTFTLLKFRCYSLCRLFLYLRTMV